MNDDRLDGHNVEAQGSASADQAIDHQGSAEVACVSPSEPITAEIPLKRATWHRTCIVCKQPFETTAPGTKICGPECKAERIRQLYEADRARKAIAKQQAEAKAAEPWIDPDPPWFKALKAKWKANISRYLDEEYRMKLYLRRTANDR